MPTYEYACTTCDEQIEVVQRFADAPLTDCPSCSGRLRKVFSPVGVVFKGSGFYKTDSRGSSRTSSAAKPAAEAGGAGETGGSTAGEAKTGDAKAGGTSAPAPPPAASGSGDAPAA